MDTRLATTPPLRHDLLGATAGARDRSPSWPCSYVRDGVAQVFWRCPLNTHMDVRELTDTIIIPLDEVLRMTSLSKSSVYALASREVFPGCVRLGPLNRVGWIKAEVEEWIASRVALRASTRGDQR